MPTVKVRNLKNKEVGEVTLSDAVFGVELNESLIHAAVVNYQANGRQGTSATKTRGNVSGSGRKLWKQKGTGRARIASLRSPLWKGGGNVHGPQPRDWSYQMPKKMRRGALRSALSERVREGNVIIIDAFEFATPRTKDFLAAVGTLGLVENSKRAKTLVIDSLDNANLILSSRNVEKTKVTNSFGLNIYDIIYHEKLLISKAAVEELNQLLDPHTINAPIAAMRAAIGETIMRPLEPFSFCAVETGAGAGAGCGCASFCSTAAGCCFDSAPFDSGFWPPADTGGSDLAPFDAVSARRAEMSSPLLPMMAMASPRAAVSPPALRILRSVPPERAVISIVALSVSTSARVSFASKVSPSFFTQREICPSSMVGESFGIKNFSAICLN